MAQATLTPVAAKPPGRRSARRWSLSATIGVCAALLLAALALPLTRGHVYVADDLGEFHLPARAFYADALAHGQRFDWWPQLFGGFYLTGEGQAGTYHPLHLVLYRFLPLATAFNLEVVLSYPWMFLGTWLWLRRRLPNNEGALFGALLFTFSAFNLLHLPHVNAVSVVAQLPWLLWAIDVALLDPRPRARLLALVAVALLTASQLLLGYPQYVWYSLLLEVAYVGWVLRQSTLHAPREGSITRSVMGTLGAFAIGVLLGAIQWLPTWDMLSTSVRHDAGTAFAETGSLHPWNLMQLVAPYLFVNRVVGLNTHELGLYAGCVPLVLCAWLWIRRRELGRLRPLAIAAATVAALSLWMALGEHGYIYRVQTWLPVVGKFRFPCRMIVLFHLCVAVLAAIALTLLVRRQQRTPAQPPPCTSLVPLAPPVRYALLWALILTSIIVALAAALAWPTYVARWPLVVAGPLLIAVAALLVWLADRNNRAALTALVVLAAADLGAYGLSYSVFGRTETLAQFNSQWPSPPSGAGRLLVEESLADARTPRTGNGSLLAGWSRIDGYAGLEPARRLDYSRVNPQRVAGVGWIASENHEGWVLAPTRFASSPARLVGIIQTSADSARDIAKIDPDTTALIEPDSGTSPRLRLGSSPGHPVGHVSVIEESPGHFAMETNSTAPNLLVINQSWHRGWRASIDGQPASVERVNGDFFGTVVPAGTHCVEFDFQPASLRYGALLSAGGLACLVLGTIWLARSNRIQPCAEDPTP